MFRVRLPSSTNFRGQTSAINISVETTVPAFCQGGTSCSGIFSPADPGTVDGTWNLNVKNNGEAEISIVIFRDGKNQANWGFVQWESADDNNPGSFYHYGAVLSPFLTLDVTYNPGTGVFVFQAFHPSCCIGKQNIDAAA